MKQPQEVQPDSANWQHAPLCCNYLIAHFGTVRLQVGELSQTGPSPVYWAVGTTREGEYEVLGVWACEATGTWEWKRAVDEMVIRGVERIRFVTGEHPIDSDLKRLGATHLRMDAVGDEQLTQLTSTLPRYLRSGVKSAWRQSRVAQASILRLTRRRGGIDMLESALGAVEKSLQQAGREGQIGLSRAQVAHPRKASAVRSQS